MSRPTARDPATWTVLKYLEVRGGTVTFPAGEEPLRTEALHRAQQYGLVTWRGRRGPFGDMDTVRLTRAGRLTLRGKHALNPGQRLLGWALRAWRQA